MEIVPALKEYVDDKIDRMSRYFNNITETKIIFEMGKGSTFTAELIASLPRNNVFVVKTSGTTATEAFDMAIDKMERKLRNFKERLSSSTDKATRRIIREIKRGSFSQD